MIKKYIHQLWEIWHIFFNSLFFLSFSFAILRAAYHLICNPDTCDMECFRLVSSRLAWSSIPHSWECRSKRCRCWLSENVVSSAICVFILWSEVAAYLCKLHPVSVFVFLCCHGDRNGSVCGAGYREEIVVGSSNILVPSVVRGKWGSLEIPLWEILFILLWCMWLHRIGPNIFLWVCAVGFFWHQQF